MAKATQIIISDDSEQDYESGDEQHVFYVFAADDDGDTVGHVQTLQTSRGATDYARSWARNLGISFGWD